MTKYLVTGSTGFIGSRLLGLLNTIECDVRLLARSEVNNYETVVCNLGQDRIPKRTLESIDTIFHLAGFAHDMQDSNKVEDLYRAINVEATVELARLAVKNGVKQFIFISSVKAGGKAASKKCINESDQSEPEGAYGETKYEVELRLLKIGKASGMHVAIIRPSLVYGPNVKGNLKLMLAGIKKGWFPPLPETGNRRSMIHVDDLVRAILLIAEEKRANGEIFIATDGTPHSSREIYNTMCSVLDKSIPKWSVPKFLFNLISLISPKIKYKVDKLLGDECYSSVKLEELGFKAKKSLKDMNETDF
ncbi:NAD-dependent epimerase/dehydratase family protein [Candidatus Thioglobus sp.]|nr:NAD-dependent epimerase/dehydratase family protein [Candidatus Thioglobus sp.]